MVDIALGISVNRWNAIRFVIVELFVSVVFASLWNLLIRRCATRSLHKGNQVTIVPSNLGRFTPAEVICCSTRRLTDDRTHPFLRGKLVLAFINLILFVLLLLLEFGSSDLPDVKKEVVDVVTARSIVEHSARFARDSTSITENPPNVLKGFKDATLRSFQPREIQGSNMSEYELMEHVLDNQYELARIETAVSIERVCGDNDLEMVPECKPIHESLVGNESNPNPFIFARVTRVHPYRGPGVYTRLYNLVLDSTNLAGTCYGHQFRVATGADNTGRLTVESDGCVFRDSVTSRTFVVFPEALRSFDLSTFDDKLTLHSTNTPVEANSTVMFQAGKKSVLSFVSSIDVEPITAAFHLVQHGHSYLLLSEMGLNSSVFAEYCEHIMLLCHGLSGEYFEKKSVELKLESTQAAVNTSFIVAVSGLLFMSLVIGLVSLLLGRHSTTVVPSEIRGVLREIRQSACQQGMSRRCPEQAASVDMKLERLIDGTAQRVDYVCENCSEEQQEKTDVFGRNQRNGDNDEIPSFIGFC